MDGTTTSVQQLVFVGRTCGSIHMESFNKNEVFAVKKIARRLIEEQDKVLLSPPHSFPSPPL
jgi:hypothetical protein